MIIALAQIEIEYGNRKNNLEAHRRLIENAAIKGCEAVFFPEMSISGISIRRNRDEMDSLFSPEDEEETMNFFKQLAVDRKITIGFGWGKKTGVKGENHYSIIDTKGEVIMDYAKIHPFSFGGEDKYFEGGESVEYCQIDDFKVGVGICYDLRFPELFTKLGKICELVIVPANWPYVRHEAWETLLKARAMDNQVYMVGINCGGVVDGVEYSGESMFVNPLGKTLIKSGNDEELIIIQLENDVKKYREEFPVLKDRKEDLYKSFF